MEALDRVNKRLIKVHCITLQEYNERLDLQNHVCRICKRPPKGIRLAVDHDHGVHKIRIEVLKLSVHTYTASAVYKGKEYFAGGVTRKIARYGVWVLIRRAAIRGLICAQCNRALGKIENPRWQWTYKEVYNAAKYLEEFHGESNQKTVPSLWRD